MNVSKEILRKENVSFEEIRLIDHDVASGVYPDMTEYGWETDEWPQLYKKIIAADILIIGTPIWLGEKSSETQKLIERLYAMSGKVNDKGQYVFLPRRNVHQFPGHAQRTTTRTAFGFKNEITLDSARV